MPLTSTLRPGRCWQRVRFSTGRAFSCTSVNQSAVNAAENLLSSFADKTFVRRQVLDANQLQKLSLTLGRARLEGVDISEKPPPVGTPVPPGWHLVYFTPNGLDSELGPDGTDRSFNAPSPFTRRMWAGGRMKWPKADSRSTEQQALLRVGDEVEEHTRLVTATAKKSRSAGEMVLVEVEKEFWGPMGLSLVDRRSWIFRPEITPESIAKSNPRNSASQGPSVVLDTLSKESAFPSRHFRWSSVGLFRFSALTFNGHMIHYNEDWTRRVEGHPAEVVHGPLNLINILDYWRDVHGEGAMPNEIEYKATSPLYVGDSYRIRTQEVNDTQDGRIWKIDAEKDAITCFSGNVLYRNV